MKTAVFFSVFSLLVVALGSAQVGKSADYPPGITVIPSIRHVPDTVSVAWFNVTTNTVWHLSCNEPWCIYTPVSWGGNGNISVVVLDNLSLTSRIAYIRITANGVPDTIIRPVVQAGAPPAIAVTPSNQNVFLPAGSTNFGVASNTNWIASCNAPWCYLLQYGTGNDTVVLDYTKNTSGQLRQATIEVAGDGLPVQTVTVTQSADLPMLAISPADQKVASAAGSTAFGVVSNTNWTVACYAPWCAIKHSGFGNDSIKVDFDQNTTDQLRMANIEVAAPGLPFQTVTVTQDKASNGLGESPESSLQIIPNPTAGMFRITSNTTFPGPVEVTIRDLNWKEIFRKEGSMN